jgi:hypothetical protein
MDILESIKESLTAKRYHKPRIEVGNYYLKWNEEKPMEYNKMSYQR